MSSDSLSNLTGFHLASWGSSKGQMEGELGGTRGQILFSSQFLPSLALSVQLWTNSVSFSTQFSKIRMALAFPFCICSALSSIIFPWSFPMLSWQTCYLIFKNLFIYFREKGREEEREGEKHQHMKHWWVASCTPPTGDWAHNPGLCPDWESIRQPFTLQADTQVTEPQQPGQSCYLKWSLANREFSFSYQWISYLLKQCSSKPTDPHYQLGKGIGVCKKSSFQDFIPKWKPRVGNYIGVSPGLVWVL